MSSRLTSSILFLTALILSGCLGMAPTEVPLPSIESADARSRHDSVVIMLPGRGDRADTFIREGFEKAGDRWGFDTIAVDAHFGYYMERSLLPRLHEDVIVPAHAAGYENVWLLGISMGGFGSLLYASEHPDQVDGVILLAPFLGDQDAIGQIIDGGGIGNLDAVQTELQDYEVAVWSWLRDATSDVQPTPVILGYGLSDGMAQGYRALVDVIDPSSVYTLEGGHKWTTWGPLWERIAADLEL
jgi:pimeloyl-ACP methyl ester carboxylesterase